MLRLVALVSVCLPFAAHAQMAALLAGARPAEVDLANVKGDAAASFDFGGRDVEQLQAAIGLPFGFASVVGLDGHASPRFGFDRLTLGASYATSLKISESFALGGGVLFGVDLIQRGEPLSATTVPTSREGLFLRPAGLLSLQHRKSGARVELRGTFAASAKGFDGSVYLPALDRRAEISLGAGVLNGRTIVSGGMSVALPFARGFSAFVLVGQEFTTDRTLVTAGLSF